MPDKKISELPAATEPLNDADLVEIVQGGVNKKAPKSAFGGGAVDSVNGQTGVVVLDAGDIANTPAGSIAATDVQTAINELDTEKAPLASPTFTGTPTAPTAAVGTDTTQIATTAYVVDEIASRAPKVLVIACSDEVTPITATAGKVTFRMPYAMTLTAVRASLTTTQTSGSIFTVDINESSTSILSTKLTIDNTETTSTTAATPAVISDSSLADNAVITIDVDQIGDNTAKGLKVYLIGT